MKKSLLFFTFMLFTFSGVLGAAPFTFNGKRKLTFSERDFNRYILPKLAGIRRDFFSLFNHLGNLYSDLVRGERILADIFAYREVLPAQCSRGGDDCEQSLQQLHLEFIRLEILLNKLEGKMKGPSSQERLTLWVKEHADFHSKVLEMMGRLQQVLLLHGVNSALSASFAQELPHIFRSLRLSYERLLFSPLSEDQRKLFSEVYYSFILPIDKYVLSTESENYLKKNVESLNFAWNDFHMKVSKSNRSFPSKVLSQALQIHRQWVAILRVMLRQ